MCSTPRHQPTAVLPLYCSTLTQWGLCVLVGGRPERGGMLDQYVNDRPYVASSFMSVAIARVFNSALAGNSKDRPELVTVPLPLTARVAVLRCRGGEEFLRRLFEPLGYQVVAEYHPLDEKFPEWGEGPHGYPIQNSRSQR
jgi:hypothetical protein